MKRKLLQINPVVRLNTSTGRIMKEIGELAMAHGWESHIAYSGGRDGLPSHSSQLMPVGNKRDVAWHALMTRLFDAHGLASPRATRHLIRQIEKLDPDIIHIHNVHGYWLHYPLFFEYLKRSGKPVIWTVHDCWLYTGHCYYYSFARCAKWRTGCGRCPQKRSFPASWIFDRSVANWKDKQAAYGAMRNILFVPVSDWIRQEMASSFLGRHRFQVIHNGIDLSVFCPEAAEKEREIILYLAVASIWHEEKGFPDLVQVAGLLREDEQLVLVGKMTEDQKKRMPARVHIVERTENVQALAALYAQATVLLNPTWQDNYPTVNLEAIACGTPVVTYRTGGSVEALTEATGRIVPQGDVPAMLVAARELAADRTVTSVRCREHALRHFDKEACYLHYIALYERLAAR